jgi:Holliday junction resolvase
MGDDFTPKRPRSRIFDKEPTTKKSQRQENKLAGRLGGKRQKGSGALPHHKGDVKTQELLIECKRTDKKSMAIKKEWLEKISKEALASHRVPALAIEFGDVEPLVENNWVAVPAKFFEELMEVYREQDDGTDKNPQS